MNKKGWPPPKIRGRLIEKEVKIIDIANKFGTSRQMVNYVINAKFKSARLADRIRREIAISLGKRYEVVWGVLDKEFWERYK
jgi:hypothetical protein